MSQAVIIRTADSPPSTIGDSPLRSPPSVSVAGFFILGTVSAQANRIEMEFLAIHSFMRAF
jgi:hypothetical protein